VLAPCLRCGSALSRRLVINDPRRGVAYVPFKINPYFRSAQVSSASSAHQFESIINEGYANHQRTVLPTRSSRYPFCCEDPLRPLNLGATASATSSAISVLVPSFHPLNLLAQFNSAQLSPARFHWACHVPQPPNSLPH